MSVMSLGLESGEWTFQEATLPSPQKLSERFRLVICPSVLLVISKYWLGDLLTDCERDNCSEPSQVGEHRCECVHQYFPRLRAASAGGVVTHHSQKPVPVIFCGVFCAVAVVADSVQQNLALLLC